MSTINIPTFLNIDLNFTLSSKGKRYGAYAIDWLIKAGYIFIILNLFNISFFSSSPILSMFFYMPVMFYSLLLEYFFNGQTIGKKLLGIRVIGVSGNTPSFSQVAIRWMFLFADAYLFLILSFMSDYIAALTLFGPLVGVIFIASTATQQRLGDIAAQTYVVSVEEDHYSFEDTIYAYSTNRPNFEVKYPDIIKLSDKDMTIIQNLLEKSEYHTDYDLAQKVANHVKNILKIESGEDDYAFLRKLLSDYNYLSIKNNI